METHGIVKGFDVLEHAHPRGFQVNERFMLGPSRPEEPLGDYVVVALARSTHRAFDVQRPQGPLIRVARGLLFKA